MSRPYEPHSGCKGVSPLDDFLTNHNALRAMQSVPGLQMLYNTYPLVINSLPSACMYCVLCRSLCTCSGPKTSDCCRKMYKGFSLDFHYCYALILQEPHAFNLNVWPFYFSLRTTQDQLGTCRTFSMSWAILQS